MKQDGFTKVSGTSLEEITDSLVKLKVPFKCQPRTLLVVSQNEQKLIYLNSRESLNMPEFIATNIINVPNDIKTRKEIYKSLPSPNEVFRLKTDNRATFVEESYRRYVALYAVDDFRTRMKFSDGFISMSDGLIVETTTIIYDQEREV